ncbi:uncharacterized protein LOC105434199 [Pogonomyrmex barbatus]|uniref:Uncharacterized protein LOC105434199 n=1 Tax=Pogonomyrmex barbatus TaxID=144034 RepID=A0A6I9WXA3_9HYME|nr:uncharacterized protein LOC105434199 [Pogonomyrmex barbatus]
MCRPHLPENRRQEEEVSLNRGSSFLKSYKFVSIQSLKTKCARRAIFIPDKRRQPRDAGLIDKCQGTIFVLAILRRYKDPLMDWRNEEPNQSSVENLKWDENDHPVIRTRDAVAAVDLDRNRCSQGVQVGLGICKDIGNFTSALENLELETKNHSEFRISDGQTDYFDDSEQEETVPVFKTREKSTFQLVIQGPEILIFQGIKHSPADIAPYWKKDSRMWLWKSVRLARKLKRTKAKAVASAGALYRKDLL